MRVSTLPFVLGFTTMDDNIQQLLIKYITGNAGEDEQQYVRQWIGQSGDNLEYFISLKATWQDALHHPGEQVVNTSQAFSRLQARLQIPPAENKSENESGKQYHHRRQWPRIIKVAAMIAVILTAGGTGIYLLFNNRQQPVQQAAYEIFVPKGKMKKLLLPDSSEVWLNAGTRFGYAAGFGQQKREVFLEGEGYFNVRHNEKIPFTVNARGYMVRDIGTVFTITAYPGNKNFEAAVIEGKVEVTGDLTLTDKTDKVFLAPNHVLKIVQNKPASGNVALAPGRPGAINNTALPGKVQSLVNMVPDMDSYTGWKDHLLVFNEETFYEVAQRLERTFDVKIHINSEQLARFRYTGRFNKVQHIEDALKIIRETTPITYRWEKDVIIISMDKKQH